MAHNYQPHPFRRGQVRAHYAGAYYLCADCTGTAEARYSDGRPVHPMSPFVRNALAGRLPAKEYAR